MKVYRIGEPEIDDLCAVRLYEPSSRWDSKKQNDIAEQ